MLIQDAANGPAVCQLLRRQIPGLIALPPKSSKASGAHGVAPLVEAGDRGRRRCRCWSAAEPMKPAHHNEEHPEAGHLPPFPTARIPSSSCSARAVHPHAAANLSRRTGHPREDLRQIAVIGLLQGQRLQRLGTPPAEIPRDWG